jgi:MFS transporter, SP family, general alpha glucoside:H+ symporter
LTDWDHDNTIAMMEHTERVEDYTSRPKKTESTSPASRFSDKSYVACFRGSNRRRTEIACMVFMSQNMSGLPIIGYAPYLYKQIGFNQQRSFDITLGMQGLAILGAFVSLLLLKYIGKRRTLYLTGLGCCFILLAAAGAVSCIPENRATLWTLVGLILAFIFVFDATIGPLTYCLVAELPSNRLRVKTVVLARIAYNINSMVTNILIQRMLNPLVWNWRGKACFFCAALNALCFAYCYFRLPETRGLSFHELDLLFEKGADARKFATFQAILEGNGYFSLNQDERISPLSSRP